LDGAVVVTHFTPSDASIEINRGKTITSEFSRLDQTSAGGNCNVPCLFEARLSIDSSGTRHAGNEQRSKTNGSRFEFPLPHGFTRAKDYIGYEENITFLDRELCRSLHSNESPKRAQVMSALPPKADIDQHGRNVRFVPRAAKVGELP
jgi:hypothetical protein